MATAHSPEVLAANLFKLAMLGIAVEIVAMLMMSHS
jgi:hypothetical protein